jgi:hypothetical protein
VGEKWSDGKRKLLSRVEIGRIRKDLAPKSGLSSDAIKPFCQVRSCRKIKFPVGGNMAVSKNGNIRDRVRIARNERSLAELAVQNIERPVSKRRAVAISRANSPSLLVSVQYRSRLIDVWMYRCSNINQRMTCARGMPSVEQGHSAHGVLGPELRGCTLALEYADPDNFKRHAQMRREEAHLNCDDHQRT